jgi:TPR repeat protein
MNPILPPATNHGPAEVEAHHEALSTPLTFPRSAIVSGHDGIGIGKPNAIQDIELKADQGDAVAQFRYGLMLFQGAGVSMNKSLAAH